MTQTVPATTVLGPGKTGLTIGLRVLNLDGTEYAAFSTTGVAETSTLGTYRKASGIMCPDAGAYIVWGVSGTDYAEATVEPVTALSDIQSRLPAALIGGRMDATVGAMQNDTLTAAALATDAITEIAGAVLDEVYTTHATAYTLGAFLNATDPTTVTVTSSNDAGELTLYRGVTFAATVSGLTISASWTKIVFTVKTDLDLADTASTIQIVESNPGVGTDGLLYLNGAALASPITAADASLTVTQAAGTVAIALSDDATALLSRARSVHWDLKQWVSSATTLLTSGSADIELTPTRTV